MEHDRGTDIKGLADDNFTVPPICYGSAHEVHESALDGEVADAHAVTVKLDRREPVGS